MNYYNNASHYPSTSALPYYPTNGPPASFPLPSVPVNSSYQFDPRLVPKVPINPIQPIVMDNKTDDELWVETWLSKLGKITINLDYTIKINSSPNKARQLLKRPNKPPLHVARKVLIRCTNVIESLESAEKSLRENALTMSSEEWKEKTVEIGCLKDELTALFTQFEGPNTMTSLKDLVNKRKKKRQAQKRRKAQKRAAWETEKQEQIKKHKEIDEWLQSMQESIERVKRVRIAELILFLTVFFSINNVLG